MSLYLYEILPASERLDLIDQVIKQLDVQVTQGGGELIETQVTRGGERIFAVAEFNATVADTIALDRQYAAGLDGPHEVRLVGADLDQVKQARPTAGYLVEWDLPAELDMDWHRPGQLTGRRNRYLELRTDRSASSSSSPRPTPRPTQRSSPDGRRRDARHRRRERAPRSFRRRCG